MDSSQGNKVHGLLNAVTNGKVRIVCGLLDAGADVNVTDAKHLTPLMRAVYVPKEDVRSHLVRLLLSHGSEVNAKDENGRTVLMHAAFEKERQDVVRQIIRTKKCDPNVQDLNGDTALTYAVVSDNPSAIRTLVNSAYIKPIININCKNKDGLSPLQIAVNLRHSECCQILVNEGRADTSGFIKQNILKKLLSDDADLPEGNSKDISNDGPQMMSNMPVKVDESNVHSHKKGMSDEFLYNLRGNKRKDDTNSSKINHFMSSGMIKQIQVKAIETNDTVGGTKTTNTVKSGDIESDNFRNESSGFECETDLKANISRPAINRPTFNQTNIPKSTYESSQVSELMEAISHCSLSPRSEYYKTNLEDTPTLSTGSEVQVTSQLFHKKKIPSLSPDAELITDMKTKANIIEQQKRKKSISNFETSSSENIVSVDSQPDIIGRYGHHKQWETDSFSTKKISCDKRRGSTPGNGPDIEDGHKSAAEFSSITRYPARLRPLSATVSYTSEGHVSFPHI